MRPAVGLLLFYKEKSEENVKHQDKGYTANLGFRLHRSDGSAVEKLHTAYLWTIQIQVITMKWLSRPYCTWCGCTVITMPPH